VLTLATFTSKISSTALRILIFPASAATSNTYFLSCAPAIEPGTGKLWYLAAEPRSGLAYKLNPADILHFKAYSPDGIRGVSVLRRAQQTLQTAAAAQEYERALYENGGRPGGVLKTQTDLGQTIKLPDGTEVHPKDLIRREWEKVHAGAGNGFRLAVLDQGLEYQPIAMSNADVQFVDNRAVTIADIARFFSVPDARRPYVPLRGAAHTPWLYISVPPLAPSFLSSVLSPAAYVPVHHPLL